MRISAAFPSQYLKAADLQGRRVSAVMSHVSIEEVGSDPKPILYFIGKEKGLVLNKTNSNSISMVYGDETDAWSGHAVELFEAMVDFQGRTVPAIRVSVPRSPAARAPIAATAAAPAAARAMANGAPQSPIQPAVIDDDIPF